MMTPQILLKLLSGALAGGAIAWIWGAISWMALPWHHNTFLAFTNEPDIERVMLAGAPQSGVYGLPAPPRHGPEMDTAARAAADLRTQQQMIKGPIVTAVIQRGGFGSVPFAMVRAFFIYAAFSLVCTWLLLHTGDASYWSKVTFVAAVGLAAGLLCRLTDWNWHGYSTAYTAVNVADHVVCAFLMGLAIARIV